MIYENFIFCLNAKKFRNHLLSAVSSNCAVMKTSKVSIRNLFSEIKAMHEGLFFPLDNAVEGGHKKLVDPPTNDGISCSLCWFDSLPGIKQA